MKLSRGQGCLVAIVVTPLLLWGAYKLFYPTYAWKERIAVTVATPDGEKSGSAVRKIKVVRTPSPLPQTSDAVISVEGEAVVVDMGNGRYLFSLLGAPLGWTPVVYQSLYPDSVGKRDISSWESSLRGKGPLPIPDGKQPLLVTFGDINDPASVKQVDPDDLDTALGVSPAFGCDQKISQERAPWLSAGMSHDKWAYKEALRLANEGASERAGITGKAAAALEEYYQHARPSQMAPEKKKRLSENFTVPQRRKWIAARRALEAEIRADLPGPPKTASGAAKPCYTLKSITLEITNERVTTGKVEAVLGREFFKEFAKRFKAGLNSSDFDNSKLFYQLSRGAFIKE